MIRFANFEPDRTKYALDASTWLVNALPVKDGWGPLPDLIPLTQALPAKSLGGWSVRKQDGSYRIFAATETAIYELDGTDYSWNDVSGSSAPYAVPVGDRWSATKFGQLLILCNLGGPQQYIDIDAGLTFADLPGSPPWSRYVATVGEYVGLGFIAGYPNRFMLSGIGDAGFWTLGQRGCDLQDFADGEEIMNIQGGERGAIISQRTAFTEVALTSGGDYSFTTRVVNPSRGVIAPLSVVPIGPGNFVYLAQDGFFMGVEGRPIGAERVDGWFQELADSLYLKETRGFADPFRKIAWFQAQDVTGTKFLLGYNWQLDRWCYADNNVSEMCIMATPGITWDGMEALYPDWDSVDLPWDSALLSGGALRFAAFDADNKLGFFTGLPRACTLTTADVELNPGSRSFLQQARVYTDCTDFTLKAITSDKHGGTRTVGSAVVPYGATGLCHFRSSALLHAFQMDIPAGTDWNHVMGVEPVARPEGRR
ncbi:hypothetical protein ASD64_01300 [Mesorhizobium sp. Root157]|uniref:hypothetical protein n=1 Tax=Mesorhizobium sp. Root157 TaxID=1736477 RepID=UPI0006F6AF14|nr:hypothetical protein [Mesorhizobium sp. Root157]KRA00239.1 hypothetical protein ASD64_01300 [Mesorhizobium sp. Root157]